MRFYSSGHCDWRTFAPNGRKTKDGCALQVGGLSERNPMPDLSTMTVAQIVELTERLLQEREQRLRIALHALLDEFGLDIHGPNQVMVTDRFGKLCELSL
jgi:hypothetical protein